MKKTQRAGGQSAAVAKKSAASKKNTTAAKATKHPHYQAYKNCSGWRFTYPDGESDSYPTRAHAQRLADFARQWMEAAGKAAGGLRKVKTDRVSMMDELDLSRLPKRCWKWLYAGADEYGCDVGDYIGALALRKAKVINGELRNDARAAQSFTRDEKAVIARYKKENREFREYIDGKPLNLLEPRRIAHRIGVRINDMLREGLARVLDEYAEHGSVRFGGKFIRGKGGRSK